MLFGYLYQLIQFSFFEKKLCWFVSAMPNDFFRTIRGPNQESWRRLIWNLLGTLLAGTSATVITKCDYYYEVRQNNFRVSEIWNQEASRPPRSEERVLTSYMTMRSFLSLWWKKDTLPNCHRRSIIRPYQHRWKKNTFNGTASCKRPSEYENVQWHYHWTGETGLHRKSDRPRNHCRYLPLSPTPCLV